MSAGTTRTSRRTSSSRPSRPAAASAPQSTVKIILSNGPAPVAVPDVAGATYDDAAAQLQAKRLAPVRKEDYSDTIEAGKVIGTDPAGGQPRGVTPRSRSS